MSQGYYPEFLIVNNLAYDTWAAVRLKSEKIQQKYLFQYNSKTENFLYWCILLVLLGAIIYLFYKKASKE